MDVQRQRHETLVENKQNIVIKALKVQNRMIKKVTALIN